MTKKAQTDNNIVLGKLDTLDNKAPETDTISINDTKTKTLRETKTMTTNETKMKISNIIATDITKSSTNFKPQTLKTFLELNK